MKLKKFAAVALATVMGVSALTGCGLNKNDTIATLYFNKDENIEEAKQLVQTAFDFSLDKPNEQTMIYEIIE